MTTFHEQMTRFRNDTGFVAALDQSGGSTPKALAAYGVAESEYENDEEMFGLVHEMRSRIISDESFTSERILGAILFEGTVERSVRGKPTARYLWEEKRIVPFMKVDKGLDKPDNGVRLMKPIPDLDTTLAKAREAGAFGTKMRSVIDDANKAGINAIVEQQFELAARISKAGLVPIVEPEVSIGSKTKAEAESILRDLMQSRIDQLPADEPVILKLTLPSLPNFYHPFVGHDRVARVLALSGGYSRDEANAKLAKNNGMIASFSRALLQDLRVTLSDEAFSDNLGQAIKSIARASVT